MVGFLLFGVGIVGNPVPLIIGTPIFMLAGVQLGLIIGIFTSTQSAAVQAIGTIKLLTAFLLAGFLFPLNCCVDQSRPQRTRLHLALHLRLLHLHPQPPPVASTDQTDRISDVFPHQTRLRKPH